MHLDTDDNGLTRRRTFAGFPLGYWMLNTIEMFERLAYYLVRSVVAIYIMQADDPHGLHFTAADKGTIYAIWFAFQSILPTFTGGFADRYGYKRTLFWAVTLNVADICSVSPMWMSPCQLASMGPFSPPSGRDMSIMSKPYMGKLMLAYT